VRTTALQTTQVTEGNKSTYTAIKTKNMYVQLKTSENAEINIVQRPSESSKRTEIDGGRLFQTGDTRGTKNSYGRPNC